MHIPLPVGVENHCGVATEQRDALWKLASFLEGDNGKSTTTTSFPIDGKMFRVNLFRYMSDWGYCGERLGAGAWDERDAP